MKALKGFMVTNPGEGDVITYMYTEIDEESGELVGKNKRGSFYPMDAKGKKLVADMKKYIQQSKLG